MIHFSLASLDLKIYHYYNYWCYYYYYIIILLLLLLLLLLLFISLTTLLHMFCLYTINAYITDGVQKKLTSNLLLTLMHPCKSGNTYWMARFQWLCKHLECLVKWKANSLHNRWFLEDIIENGSNLPCLTCLQWDHPKILCFFSYGFIDLKWEFVLGLIMTEK